MIDLDAAKRARAETKGEGPVVTWNGKQMKLPPEVPYEAMELVGDLEGGDSSALRPLMKALLGENYEDFLEGKPSVDDMMTLVNALMGKDGYDLGEVEASGK